MDSPNFKKAKEEAYKILISQENFTFPINPKNIKLKQYNIIVVSFQEYAQKTNLNINQLTIDGNFNDGYTLIKNDDIFIFYNEDIETEGRKTWTIAHELGHVILQHYTQCDKNEIEANFFASQLLVPQCVLRQLIKNGAKITPVYLSEKFKISYEASKNCIHTLDKVIDKSFLNSQYDDIIIKLFEPYIFRDYSNEMFFDDLEKRRQDFNLY